MLTDVKYSFVVRVRSKFLNKADTKRPRQSFCVAILPCEIPANLSTYYIMAQLFCATMYILVHVWNADHIVSTAFEFVGWSHADSSHTAAKTHQQRRIFHSQPINPSLTISTPVLRGWAVAFGTNSGLRGWAKSPPRWTKRSRPPTKQRCTNFTL